MASRPYNSSAVQTVMKHHKGVKIDGPFGPTMQCNVKTYYHILRLSAYVPKLCPQPKLKYVEIRRTATRSAATLGTASVTNDN